MFALIFATAVCLCRPCPPPQTLREAIHASHARERYARSWHYLNATQRWLDHVAGVQERKALRRIAKERGIRA